MRFSGMPAPFWAIAQLRRSNGYGKNAPSRIVNAQWKFIEV
jgi:hypothetical protein